MHSDEDDNADDYDDEVLIPFNYKDCGGVVISYLHMY